MALVAYDYSSDSDNEITDEEESTSATVVLNGTHKNNFSQKVVQQTQDTEDVTNQSNVAPDQLFSNLPESKPTTYISDENDKLEDFIPTLKSIKEKKKVQITIPSLKDFEEPNDEEPLKKRVKPSPKGSGLLGILPPVQTAPLSNTTFVPKAVKKKNIPSTSTSSVPSTSMMPHSVRKNIEVKKALLAKSKAGSDSETDDEDIPIPDTFDDQMWEKVCGKPKAPAVIKVREPQPIEPEEFTIAPEPEKPYDGLDNEAFKELVGKTKKPIGNIKLIDINEDEIVSDKDTWMMKSLTDPDMAPKGQADDSVDPTRKRKHHITYLAQQARANEQELKSAWASSRQNRMMSRSKYGF